LRSGPQVGASCLLHLTRVALVAESGVDLLAARLIQRVVARQHHEPVDVAVVVVSLGRRVQCEHGLDRHELSGAGERHRELIRVRLWPSAAGRT